MKALRLCTANSSLRIWPCMAGGPGIRRLRFDDTGASDCVCRRSRLARRAPAKLGRLALVRLGPGRDSGGIACSRPLVFGVVFDQKADIPDDRADAKREPGAGPARSITRFGHPRALPVTPLSGNHLWHMRRFARKRRIAGCSEYRRKQRCDDSACDNRRGNVWSDAQGGHTGAA